MPRYFFHVYDGYQPVDEVVAPRSTHYKMWSFAALGATYCG